MSYICKMKQIIKVLILLITLSAPAFAQQPRIDSIAVDEDKGELVLRGNFQNSASAIVTVDSVSLPVILASDTMIRVTIPDSSKGSAGWATTIINGIESNQKLITYFHFEVSNSHNHLYSDGTSEIAIVDNKIHLRGDILSLNGKGSNYFTPSKISKYRIIAHGSNGIHGGHYYGAQYDSTVVFSRTIYFNAQNSTFDFFYWMPNYYDTTQIAMYTTIGTTSGFQIVHTHNQDYPFGSNSPCLSDPPGTCADISSLAPTDFPPLNLDVPNKISSNIFQFKLSSDPVSANAYVVLILQENATVGMEILDVLGNVKYSNTLVLQTGENRLPLNTSALASGIYICRLQAGGDVVSVRFIKE